MWPRTPLTLALAAALSACASSPPVRTTTPVPPPVVEAPEPVAAVPTRPEPIEVAEGVLSLLPLLEEAGFPSLEGHSLVYVTTGEQVMRGDEMVDEVLLGVLLAEDADTFTVVHALQPHVYHSNQHWRTTEVGHERAVWTEVLEHEITTAQASVDTEQAQGMPYSMSRRAPPRLHAFFVGRAAIQNGHERLGRRLLALAAQMEGPSMPLDAPEDGVAGLRGDLAFHLLALRVAEYGENDLDRPQLTEHLARIEQHFAGTEAAIYASALAPVISRMILEDGRGASGDEWEQRVFALRDSGWGGARRQLAEAGLDAAPALVAILEDERVTRTVHRMRRLPRIETYGQVARDLLEQLSGESLLTVAAGEAWLRQVQRQGQDELFASQVRLMDHRSPSALQRLLRLDARRGLREGQRAIRGAPDHVRASLIRVLADSDAEVPARFYRGLLDDGSLDSRVRAALALAAMDDSSWVGPMIGELRSRMTVPGEGADAAQQQQQQRSRRSPMETYSVRRVLSLLVEHGGARGMEALLELFPGLGLDQRVGMLQSISRVRTTDEEATRRIQGFLVRALDDPTPVYVRYAYGRSARCVGTVGDLAGVILAERTNTEYPCAQSPARRALRRVELANTQHAQAGEATAPLPVIERAPTPSAGDLNAAELALRTATRTESIQSALARFTALGAPAAPRLWDLARAYDDNDPRALHARRAASALASTITSVTIEDDARPLAVRSAYEALQGQPLTAVTLPSVFARAVSASTSGRVTISLYRDAAGRGVSLHVRASSPERAYAGLFRLQFAARAGDARPERGAEHLSLAQALGMRGYRTLARELGRIAEAPPPQDGEAVIVLTWAR